MIELYTWPTPNGQKIHIMLEETGLPYTVHPVNIGAGEQFAPDFLEISPNNKMPAIVDTEGPDGAPISIFESGAILMYLGEKTGRFFPQAPRQRWTVVQWVMFQMASVGPMFGQRGHFRNYAKEKLAYPLERYSNEARRICGVMDRRLGEAKFLAGDEYTIADIACYPWLVSYKNGEGPVGEFANLSRWMDVIAARPATERGMKVLAERRRQGPISEKERAILFGQEQYARR
ncbi:MAG: glutathione S-transferase N-terminal domain-containing protein [Alphaproteobacteria bacterium]|nr:glutathione S-transferase N-terminal domain-containing protein [Alphaproteobacteria bacterium]